MGRAHAVDCEVTFTGQAAVPVGGAFGVVNHACIAAEGLADNSWTGFIGAARTTMRVFFGNIVALSIAVNVIN